MKFKRVKIGKSFTSQENGKRYIRIASRYMFGGIVSNVLDLGDFKIYWLHDDHQVKLEKEKRDV